MFWFRLQSVAVFLSVMQTDKFMCSIQWTLVWPGSIWCLSACLQILVVEVRSPSLRSFSLLKAGKEPSILCLTAWLTRESPTSHLLSHSFDRSVNSEYCHVFQQCSTVPVFPAAFRHSVGCGELLHRAGVWQPLWRTWRLFGSALSLWPRIHWTKLLC